MWWRAKGSPLSWVANTSMACCMRALGPVRNGRRPSGHAQWGAGHWQIAARRELLKRIEGRRVPCAIEFPLFSLLSKQRALSGNRSPPEQCLQFATRRSGPARKLAKLQADAEPLSVPAAEHLATPLRTPALVASSCWGSALADEPAKPESSRRLKRWSNGWAKKRNIATCVLCVGRPALGGPLFAGRAESLYSIRCRLLGCFVVLTFRPEFTSRLGGTRAHTSTTSP